MTIKIIRSQSQLSAGPKGVAPSNHEREKLDAELLTHAEALLSEWCGEISVSGAEITMRNPLRADESLGSFKFNVVTGAWSDFATEGFSGLGLTMLYASLNKMPIAKARTALSALSQNVTLIPKSALVVQKTEKPKVEAVNPEEVMLPPDVHPELGFPTLTWEYRDTDNYLSFYVYRFDNNGKKETRPLAWAPDKNEWRWQYPPSPFTLYRLPGLRNNPNATVIVTEGEKAADAAQRQFPEAVAITSACGSDQANRTDWSPLKGRQIIVVPDNDSPGKHYALSVIGAAVAQGATSVKVANVWALTDWVKGDDLADHEVAPSFLDDTVEAFSLFEATELEPHIVKAATWLSLGDFDRNKKTLADKLGIGVRTFEGLVKEARVQKQQNAEADVVEHLFEDDALEPWDETVEGDALFAEVVALIKRYVILTESQSVAVACWIIFSYGYDSMRICPQLLINSPSKRCGKSTLLELIMCLVRRPLPAANISSAAVFRSIEAWKPTLLIDEADTFLNSKSNEDITGILNSGHNRSLAYVVRTQEVDGDHVPVRFSTFCPKVIAMIKAPADTIIDRSIVITLVRKLSLDRVEAMAINAPEQLKDTRRRLLRWDADNRALVAFDIEGVPAMGNDRARQNWAVLGAFAKMLGPKAQAGLLKAASELADTSDIEENLEVDLLADIRDIVNLEKGAHIQSKVLVQKLVEMSHRPWVEVNKGKLLTENKLAQLLRPFKIKPDKFRDGVKTPRGYLIAGLHAIFDRYLPVGQEVSV